jgi:hypothetical protein
MDESIGDPLEGLTVPDDLSGLGHLSPADFAAYLDPSDGFTQVVSTVAPATCVSSDCAAPADGIGDYCAPCDDRYYRRRLTSPTPPRRTDLPVPKLDAFRRATRQIASSLSATETARAIMLMETIANMAAVIGTPNGDEGFSTCEPDEDGRTWTILSTVDEVKYFVVWLLHERGIEMFGIDGPPKCVPTAKQVVKSTFDGWWHLIDRFHMGLGVPAPMRTILSQGDPTWKANARRSYLKNNAGMGRDPLMLDTVFQLLIALQTPSDRQTSAVLLTSLVCDPAVAVIDGPARNISPALWDASRLENFETDNAGGWIATFEDVGNTRGQTSVAIPAGSVANGLLTARILALHGMTDAEGKTFIAPSKHTGPIIDVGGGRNGPARALATVIAAAPDPTKWKQKRTFRAPSQSLLRYVISDYLAPSDPLLLRDIAWLSNALFVAARGEEILGRVPDDVRFTALGPCWRMPRKPDKVGRLTPYVAPHLRWPILDPSRILSTWMASLRNLWAEQGNDPHKFNSECPLFPSNPSDITGSSDRITEHMTNRLRKYQQEFDFMPDNLNLGTHSMRDGWGTSGRQIGISDAALMQQGGWQDVNQFHTYFATIAAGSAHNAGVALRSKIDEHFDPGETLTARIVAVVASRPLETDDCTCEYCSEGEFDDAQVADAHEGLTL